MNDFLSHLPSGATLESSHPAELVKVKSGESTEQDGESQTMVISLDSSRMDPHTMVVLGRQQASVDTVLPHKSVSRQHAAMCYDGNGNLVLLNGKAKTFVNEQRVNGATIVRHNDTLRFGNILQYTVKYGLGSSEEVSKDAEPQKLKDQEKIAQAGEGLSGRDKRQAEIAAMMASLDQAPTYQPVATPIVEEQPTELVKVKPRSSKIDTLAERHTIPIADCFALDNGTARCTTIAVDPAGSRFAVGTTQLALHLYDFGGMNQRRSTPFSTVYPEPGYCPVAVSFSQDRLSVATGSAQPAILNRQGELQVQCARGDMYVQDMHHTIAHTAAVTGIQWHPLERNRFVTSSLDGSVRWWNVETGKKQFDKLTCTGDQIMVVKNKGGRKTTATAVALHPGGRAVCVGTSCGSLQIWTRTNRPDRGVFDGTSNVRSIGFSSDGKRIVCRYEDGSVEVRTYPNLKLWVACEKVGAMYEHCNAVFSPDASIVCAGASGEDGGALHFFAVQSAQSEPVSPLFVLPLNNGVTVVQWHARINQIFAGCDNGDVFVFSDRRFSTKGAVQASTKAGKKVDALDDILQQRATGSVGQIVAPLHRENLNVRKKRKRDIAADPARELEPERPATGKHKAGGRTGTNLTFQQFVADKRIGESKDIAGKDPREALLKYKEGKAIVDRAYAGNESKLADKTAEQEEEEANKRT